MSKTRTRTIAAVVSAAMLGASVLAAVPAGASDTGPSAYPYHRTYGHRIVPAIGNGFVNFVNAMIGATVGHRRYSSHPTYAGDPYSRDAAWCSTRYRSYTPASGTFTGYDRMQHHCP